MSKPRSKQKPGALPPPDLTMSLWKKWTNFWFANQPLFGLHVIRVATCCLLLAWLLPLAGHVDEMLGLNGMVDLTAYQETAKLEQGPPAPFSWSIYYLAGNNPSTLQALFWGSVAVILLFGLGIATRVTSILTWVIVVSSSANPYLTGDLDVLLILLTFYLMLGYALAGITKEPASWLDHLLLTREYWLFFSQPGETKEGTSASTVALRLIQINFALLIVVMGLFKLTFPEWWGGIGYWYSLNPASETTVEQLQQKITDPESYFYWLSLMSYAVLVWQIAFPFFAWKRGWMRAVLLTGLLAGFIGTWYFYQQPFFGLALTIGCLSYITPQEWAWVRNLIQRKSEVEEDTSREGQSVTTGQSRDYAVKAG